MRTLVTVVSAWALAACGPQAPAQDAASEAPAPESSATATLESEALVGVWSFDRSCASGDGMRLAADGTASFDEWGAGTWTTADEDRVVLTLSALEPGVGPTGETVTYTLNVAPPVTDDLSGSLVRGDAEEVRAIHARRCPEN